MDIYQSLLNTVTIAAASIVLVNKLRKGKRRTRRKPAYRVNPYLVERNLKGRYATDFDDMARNPRIFNENFHMTNEQFEKLFKLVELKLTPKRHTRPKDAIPPKLKLAIVLEYLASGDVQRHVASCYRVSKQHFGTIIDQVCDAICDVLKDTIPDPTKESFIEIANGFNAV